MTYSEFLEAFYDVDTSSRINSSSGTGASYRSKSSNLENSFEAYKEYLKEDERIKKVIRKISQKEKRKILEKEKIIAGSYSWSSTFRLKRNELERAPRVRISHLLYKFAGVAQLVEHLTEDQTVVGSIPTSCI